MSLELSAANRQASDHTYENSSGHERRGTSDVELSNVDVNIYDSLQRGVTDEYAYDVAGVTVTENAENVQAHSEVTLSRRSVILLVVSGVIISAVFSILTGVIVYLVTNEKITMRDQEVTTGNDLDEPEHIQTNISRLQEIIEHMQADTTRELATLKQSQVNAMRELDELRKIQTEGQIITNRQLELLKKQMNSSRQHVAFSVYSLSPDLLPDGTPTFSNTSINTGQYNVTSGRFTSPISGLYHFSVSFERNGIESGSTYCYFRVNGSGSVYVAARFSPYEATSGSVIQHLSVNDVVNLYCQGLQYVLTGDGTAVFSGFLIRQDE